jgi:HPt (histidine-containing phosphotransfer) domain-containing protein
MDPIMAQLRARYVASFPEKHALLQAAWQAIPTHPGAKLDLRVLCHKLAGSAPMYEFHELGKAAREACDAIDGSADAELLSQRINQLLAQLARE